MITLDATNPSWIFGVTELHGELARAWGFEAPTIAQRMEHQPVALLRVDEAETSPTIWRRAAHRDGPDCTTNLPETLLMSARTHPSCCCAGGSGRV